MEAPLVHAAICVGGALAGDLVPDSRKFSLNHRINVEGVAVHYAIVRRNELRHSAQPRLQQKGVSVGLYAAHALKLTRCSAHDTLFMAWVRHPQEL